MMKILVIGMLLMLAVTLTGNTENVCGYQSKMKSIYVDCSIEIGEIKSLQGVNCGPTGVGRGVDVTKQYQDISIEIVRTHDFYGPTDVHEIFPNWDADPENESSYNFTSSDEKITPIIEGGFQVFYRLGESWENNPIHNTPPSDPWKWANICKHVVMHYNNGWANGFHYNITYWEIWNEPDLTHFWTGSPEQYYELYKATAITLKEYDASLKTGAPAIAWIGNLDYSTKFIEYVIENSLPLDFFSWHLYDVNPYTFYLFSSRVEKTLHGFGLNETENILSEWNTALAGINPEEHGNAKGAAFTACVMILLQDTGCDKAFRYRGTQGNNGLHGLGLFEANGRYKKTAYAFKAMKILLESPKRLYTNEMDYNESFAFIAGLSEDRKNVTVLISNYESEYNEYNLTIENLPWNSNFTYIRYVLDDFNDLEIMEIENLSGSSFSTCEEIPANTVHLIRLTTTEEIPSMINIIKPRKGYLYIFDREIMPTLLGNTVIVGQITIEIDAYNVGGVDRVEFYIDDVLKDIDTEPPYQWTWDEFVFGRHKIMVATYDKNGYMVDDEMNVIILNSGGVK